jgi:type IV pilus assembly protein PilB
MILKPLIPEDVLLKVILSQNLVKESELYALQTYCKNANVPMDEMLMERGMITDEQLGVITAQYIQMPFIRLSKIQLDPTLVHILPEKVARTNRCMIFGKQQNTLLVALADPSKKDVLATITFKSGLPTALYFATKADVTASYQLYRKDLQGTLDKLLREALERSPSSNFADAPIEKMVDLLFLYAYTQHTSDIHIEMEERNSLVRFRMDGILHDVLFLPKPLHERVITRLKVMSSLRTDEHLAAQDGKLTVNLDEEKLDVRVSILPMVEGEKVVMRLLSTKQQAGTLPDLGMRPDDYAKVQHGFGKSFGMVLSTGPTGSGKSTSIYSILKFLNVREKNITTIEDPVEYRMRGLNQIPVNNKSGLTFASGLRSILRQDPNIIFVGEIRDGETAGIAVNAALTGHLVLSTLHTNDAAGALPRLIDMHVEPFLVASTVNAIMGQRLVRKICDKCIQGYLAPIKDLEVNIPLKTLSKYLQMQNDMVTLYKGAGCPVCKHTGYKGRIGLYEVLVVSRNIKDMIVAKQSADQILAQAQVEGMTTMLEDGLIKISKGQTSMEEVLRVTKVDG